MLNLPLYSLPTLPIKHLSFRYPLVVFVLLSLAVGLSLWWVGGERRDILVISSGLAAFYFFHRQKLAETRLMKELITEFNGRYDTLNERLNLILEQGKKHPGLRLSPRERATLYDYFNLCAEEYLFTDLGYIDPRVWEAWDKGMKNYAEDSRIRAVWDQEEGKESYYGFTFPCSVPPRAPNCFIAMLWHVGSGLLTAGVVASGYLMFMAMLTSRTVMQPLLDDLCPSFSDPGYGTCSDGLRVAYVLIGLVLALLIIKATFYYRVREQYVEPFLRWFFQWLTRRKGESIRP